MTTTDPKKIIKKCEDTFDIYLSAKKYYLEKIKELDKTNKEEKRILEKFIQFYTISLIEKLKELKGKTKESIKKEDLIILKKYYKTYKEKIKEEKIYLNIKYPKLKSIVKKLLIMINIENIL